MSENNNTRKDETTLPLKWSDEAVKQVSQVEIQKSRSENTPSKEGTDEKVSQQSWAGTVMFNSHGISKTFR